LSARWLTAIAAPLLTIGCAGGDRGPATAPSVTFVVAPSTDGTPPERPALPLTSVLHPSVTDRRLVDLALNVATTVCMAARGFDFPAYRPEEDVENPRIAIPHPFGPWTAAEVADGYGQPVEPGRQTALEAFMAALPGDIATSWGEAYNGSDPLGGEHRTITLPDGSEVESGVPEGGHDGCMAGALDAVYGDYRAGEALGSKLQELANDAEVEAEDHDGTVDQALRVWHDCMKAAGIDVDSGGDGPDHLELDYVEEPGVSDAERQAARHDIECKQRANLHDAYFVALAAAEERQIDDNRALVEASREQQDDALERAREIVAGHGG
jgi:hypothetical protein